MIYADKVEEVVENVDEELQPSIIQLLKAKNIIEINKLKDGIDQYILDNFP